MRGGHPIAASHRAPARQGEVLSTHRRPAPSGHRRVARPWTHRLLPVGLGLAVIGVGGVVGPTVVEEVSGGGRQLSLTALPEDDPGQGLIYEGLKATKADSLCAGSYQLDAQTCSHGPDTAPAGLAVRKDVTPVTAKAPEPVPPTRESGTVPTDAEIARDEGGSALTADAPALVPDAAPGEADFIMGTNDVACEGDGRSGKRVQVLYLHEFGTPSRYTDFLGSIRTWSAGVDQIFDESAAETGGSRHIRFVTTPQCRVDVAEVQLPTTALTSFTASIKALQTLGYNRNDRKYLMFSDANVYCGIATYVPDQRPGLGNRNNGGPSYGRVDAGCWSSVMAARELTQTLGAVLIDSPNSSGAGGCLDEYDLLCAPDRSGKSMRNVCPKKHETRLDCGHDDYFNTNPKPTSYLAQNWNIATSEFLLRSDGGDDVPDAVGAPEADADPVRGGVLAVAGRRREPAEHPADRRPGRGGRRRRRPAEPRRRGHPARPARHPGPERPAGDARAGARGGTGSSRSPYRPPRCRRCWRSATRPAARSGSPGARPRPRRPTRSGSATRRSPPRRPPGPG